MLNKRRLKHFIQRIAHIDNFIDLISHRKTFLINGHINPDEDCLSSMVAMALLLNYMGKQPTIVLRKENWHKFPFLINICTENSIRLIGSVELISDDYDAMIAMDTPKPSMMEYKDIFKTLMGRVDIIIMEIDHHLQADSEYIGDEGCHFVDEASSSSALVGMIATRLLRKKSLHIDRQKLFSRDFLLAIVTGIISDTDQGKTFKNWRDKHYSKYFYKQLKKVFSQQTAPPLDSISSIEDIMQQLHRLSEKEDKCFAEIYKLKENWNMVSWIALDKKASNSLHKQYGQDTMITVAKYASNMLAEESSYVSLVSYYDMNNSSDWIQVRMRRSYNYKVLDLRKIISLFAIENGGGHEGAIGFRVHDDDIADYNVFIEMIVHGTLDLIRSQ